MPERKWLGACRGWILRVRMPRRGAERTRLCGEGRQERFLSYDTRGPAVRLFLHSSYGEFLVWRDSDSACVCCMLIIARQWFSRLLGHGAEEARTETGRQQFAGASHGRRRARLFPLQSWVDETPTLARPVGRPRLSIIMASASRLDGCCARSLGLFFVSLPLPLAFSLAGYPALRTLPLLEPMLASTSRCASSMHPSAGSRVQPYTAVMT